MTKTILCCAFLTGLLTACSKADESKPAAPAPASSPPQLTITNSPSPRPPTTAVASEVLVQRGIEVRGAGNLFIRFPKTWEDKLARIPEHNLMIDSILFRSRTNGQFEAMVDVNNIGETVANGVVLRDALQKAGQGELTNSVEKSLEIHEFQGPQVTGCYFVVTDKHYNPEHAAKGDYRYLTQGYAKLGGLILSFHLVSNELSPQQAQLLEMIKTARFEKQTAASPTQ